MTRTPQRMRTTMTVLITVGMLSGCMIRQLASNDSERVYSYGSLDFSGKVWQRAQKDCQRSGQRVVHQRTDCDDWFRCVSRFTCE